MAAPPGDIVSKGGRGTRAVERMHAEARGLGITPTTRKQRAEGGHKMVILFVVVAQDETLACYNAHLDRYMEKHQNVKEAQAVLG